MDHHFFILYAAGVAELADALDLGSSAVRRAGSIPVSRTKSTNKRLLSFSEKPFFTKVSSCVKMIFPRIMFLLIIFKDDKIQTSSFIYGRHVCIEA